ncbi:hypothetical protein GW17_00016097 [Ensete ventricosum]|nr:hypothetical protein GW17_00016097 [Ensete ventricosum]
MEDSGKGSSLGSLTKDEEVNNDGISIFSGILLSGETAARRFASRLQRAGPTGGGTRERKHEPELATRGQRRRMGEDRARALGVLSSPLFFLSSFPQLTVGGRFLPSINRRQSKSTADSRNRPSTVVFWRNHPVARGPYTDNLVDRYVPPVLGGKCRNCKP